MRVQKGKLKRLVFETPNELIYVFSPNIIKTFYIYKSFVKTFNC